MNFIEEQQREAENFDSNELERLIKGHCRGELDSVRIHDFVRQVKTNTYTAVLDEIEREVGRMRTVKENTHGTASNIKYVYLNDIKTIISNLKSTEI